MKVFRFVCVPALLAAAPLAAQDVRPAWAASLDSLVLRELARTNTPGASLAVVVDGKVAYANGYGVMNAETKQPVTRETMFRVGSVTKMFTGALLAQLEATGIMDLRKPIGQYVPELKGRVASVTTEQLLTHHAGFIDNAVAYGRMGESALGEVMREVTDTLLFTAPGSVWSYSNPGFSMASYVAEAAAKARYGAMIERNVLRPSGMARATFRPLEALTYSMSQGHIVTGSGVTLVRPFTENTAQWAAGFLMASAEEVARFTAMLMDSGRVNGQPVLTPAAVRRLTTRYVAVPGTPAADSVGYGFGVQIANRNGETFWQHGGSINGFDAQAVMLPNRRVSVVLIDNLSGNPLNGVIDAAITAVTGLTPPAGTPPAAPRDATDAEKTALVGTYRMGTRTVTLSQSQNGDLIGQLPPFIGTVRMSGPDQFLFYPGGGGGGPTRFVIIRDASGRITHLHTGGRALAKVFRES
jgi:CubicO group peptidase (beta-lactamase class C family)